MTVPLRLTFVKAIMCSAMLALAACGGSSYNEDDPVSIPESSPEPTPEISPDPTPDPTPEPTPAASLSEVQSQIFTPSCAACHGAVSPQGGLSLDTETNSFNMLVNVSSLQSGLLLVNPGNPDDSYLVRKVEGGPDIIGSKMPISTNLSTDEIELIRNWISAGALQSSTVTTSSKVIRSEVEDNIESIIFKLQVSAFVDGESLSEGAVQIYLIDGGERYLASPESIVIDVEGAELIVNYLAENNEFDAIELVLNSPELASMLDIYGVQIQGEIIRYPPSL